MGLNLKKIIGAVAPTLAKAIGGPLAGTAIGEIAKKVLGKENVSEEEVAKALVSATPEQIIKLKELDQAFAKQMAEAGIELEKLETSDRANARELRKANPTDWLPNVTAILIMLGLLTLSIMLFGGDVPAGNKDIIINLMGVLEGALMSIVTFFFGSSRSSAEKDKVLGRIAEGP